MNPKKAAMMENTDRKTPQQFFGVQMSNYVEVMTEKTTNQVMQNGNLNEVDSVCMGQGLDEHLTMMHSQTSMTESNNNNNYAANTKFNNKPALIMSQTSDSP